MVERLAPLAVHTTQIGKRSVVFDLCCTSYMFCFSLEHAHRMMMTLYCAWSERHPQAIAERLMIVPIRPP
jgi:hypothetical protein